MAVALIGNEEHIENKENLSSNEGDLSVTIPTRSLREIEKLVSLGSSENSIKLFYDKGQVAVSYTHLTLPTTYSV